MNIWGQGEEHCVWVWMWVWSLTAPVSSLREGILPLKRLVKKESGIHVSVCLEVKNLHRRDGTHTQRGDHGVGVN